MTKVSVIIPTFNRENYITEAIGSVFSQTYRNFEIIVIDDGSTDNTKQVLNKYNGQIKYFYKENGGKASARNFGITKSNGAYIAFLDSDDIWNHTILEEEIKFLKTNFYDMVYSSMVMKNQKGDIIGRKPSKPQIGTFCWMLKNYGHIPVSTVLIRKQCLIKVGYFDVNLRVMEDFDWCLRVAQNCRIGFLNKDLAIYRIHKNNVSHKEHLFHHAKIYIASKYMRNHEVKSKYESVLVSQLVKNKYLLSKFYYLNNNFLNCLKLNLNALVFDPFLGKKFWEKNDTFFKKLTKFVNPYGLFLLSFMRYLLKKND